jgi:hypothetical protein
MAMELELSSACLYGAVGGGGVVKKEATDRAATDVQTPPVYPRASPRSLYKQNKL